MPGKEERRRSSDNVAGAFVENSYVKLGTFVGIIIFTMSASYYGTSVLNELVAFNKAIDERTSKVETELINLNRRLAQTNWTKFDHAIWCRVTELKNDSWMCGDTEFGERNYPFTKESEIKDTE